MDALRILQSGDITPAQMTGSYAGAMGQTQFMPDSFLKYAVDFSGTGRRDIWNDLGCVFASIANYLAREGWQRGPALGRDRAPAARLRPALAGRDASPAARGLAAPRRRAAPAPRRLPPTTLAALLLPGGAGARRSSPTTRTSAPSTATTRRISTAFPWA